ncbi:MAG: hypothetical protein ACLP1X_24470 [Polyangiaceae bacterium]
MVREDEAQQLLWRWLKRLVREHVQSHFQVAWAFERGKQGQRPHFHLLIAILSGSRLDEETARALWMSNDVSNGKMDLDPYDDGRDAAPYLTKQDEWDVGMTCPRRRDTCRRWCSFDSISR